MDLMPVVAVIGASTNREKFGNKALRAFRRRGDTVVPINPRAAEIEGERAYASVLDYPGPIDEATVYLPPAIGLRVMDEIAAKGIKIVWLNPGADGPAVVARARALGLTTRVACSIIGIGDSPARY
jgi:predicted CoA-binding protein